MIHANPKSDPSHGGGCDDDPPLPEDIHRLVRQLERIKPIFELGFYFGSLAVGVASVLAAAVGWLAFREYQVQNRVAARAQLLATEQTLVEREIEDGTYAHLQADAPAGISPGGFARHHLALLTTDPDLQNAPNARALHGLIWSTETWEKKDRAQVQGLRRMHRHAESYLYHLQTAFDYHGDKIISDGEWATWAGVVGDLGPHPVLLAALEGAHQHGYLSREFAADLRRRLVALPAHREVVAQYFPQMLHPAWIDGFPSYSYHD